MRLQATVWVTSMSRWLNVFGCVFVTSALMIGPAVARDWDAGSVSVDWREVSSEFDGTAYLFFKQDTIGIPNQTKDCNRKQIKTVEVTGARYIPKSLYYDADVEGAILSNGLVAWTVSPREKKIFLKFYLTQKYSGRDGTCVGGGAVKHNIKFNISGGALAAAPALPPSTLFAGSGQQDEPLSKTPLPPKGAWQAKLSSMLPQKNDEKDGARVTGVKLDDTPRTFGDYQGAAEIAFADHQNVSVFLFSEPRGKRTDGWIATALSQLSPITRGKGDFFTSWQKVGQVQGNCLRKAAGPGRVDVVCGIFDTELPIYLAVTGSYSGRESDSIPVPTLQALYGRLLLTRSMIQEIANNSARKKSDGAQAPSSAPGQASVVPTREQSEAIFDIIGVSKAEEHCNIELDDFDFIPFAHALRLADMKIADIHGKFEDESKRAERLLDDRHSKDPRAFCEAMAKRFQKK